MNKSELLRELRARTQAGMKDCNDALREAGDDLEKAVDIIKTKGKNIVSDRAGRVASEGLIGILNTESHTSVQIMVEVNCQTDFVAKSIDFTNFVDLTLSKLNEAHKNGETFNVASVEEARNELVSTTKENVVVRRWWVEESADASTVLVFSYLHSNGRIGTLLTLKAPSFEASEDPAFVELGSNLAMQVAAMSPLAVSSDRLAADVVERQRGVFNTQLQELNKPPAAWAKILDGKFNKWYTEVCLLDQESVVVPKTTVRQVIKNVGDRLGGEVQVVNFIRAEVGEGLEKKQVNLADEVAKLI
jgi:elongation factor Ts